jgi:hypothetical protein
MLGEIFGVKEEKRRPMVVSCMGRGYDIIHDEIKARNIFDFKQVSEPLVCHCVPRA